MYYILAARCWKDKDAQKSTVPALRALPSSWGIRPGPTAAPEKIYRLRKVLRRNSTLSREDIQQDTRQLEQELGRAFLIGKPSPEEVTVLSSVKRRKEALT